MPAMKAAMSSASPWYNEPYLAWNASSSSTSRPMEVSPVAAVHSAAAERPRRQASAIAIESSPSVAARREKLTPPSARSATA